MHIRLGLRSLPPYLWDEYRIPISPKTIYNILKAQGWVRQRRQRIRVPESLPAYPEPKGPTEVWQVDLIFSLNMILAVILLSLTFLDAFSRLLIHHELLAQASSEAAATALKKAVERKGGVPPRVIVTDKGSAFVNLKGKKLTAFQQACLLLSISHWRLCTRSIGR